MSAHSGTSNGSGPASVMQFSTDLNEQEAPPPLPQGEYAAEIINAGFRTSQTTGNMYASIQFRVPSSEYPADFEGDPDGTTLTYNRLVMEDTPAARWRVRKFLEAIGAKLGRTFDPTDILGLSGVLVIGHSEYEGEMRAEIKKVNHA